MKVSVIIPTRNRPESCDRLLKALMPQTDVTVCDGKIEVIVVDDHSSPPSCDQLAGKLLEYAPGSIRFISRDCAGGPSAARNSGIAEAGGDILIFLDDDCIPGPGYLKETVRLHRRYPDVLLINGNLRALRNDSISRFWFYYYDYAFNHGSGELYQIHRVSSGNFSIKRSLMDSLNPLFDEGLTSREDYDLYLRLHQAGIPVFKADSVHATIECRRTLTALLRQRAWYQRGETGLRLKYGKEFLRQAQSGQYPKRSIAFIHIYMLLYAQRKLRSLRQRWLAK